MNTVLKQDSTTKNFYYNAGVKVAVFSFDTSLSQFDLGTAFTASVKWDFSVIFFKADTPDFGAVHSEMLKKRGRHIMWLDAFTVAHVRLCQTVDIEAGSNKIIGYNIAFGPTSNYLVFLENDNSASISFKENGYQIEVNDKKNNSFFAHNKTGRQSKAIFTKAIIPLTNSRHIDKRATSITNNMGAFCFVGKNDPGNNYLIQPVTPFLYKRGKNQHLDAPHFFERDDYNNKGELLVTVFPFNDITNEKTPYSSYAEYLCEGEIRSNLINDFSKKSRATFNGNRFLSRLTFIEEADDKSSRCFFFIPEDGQMLKLKNDGGKTLIGNSGTECINDGEVTFVFKESEAVNYSESVEDFVDKANCKTAYPQFPEKFTYHLDSEKSSLFRNNAIDPLYSFIPKAEIASPLTLPVNPTFSFKENPNLIELEEIFSRVRLTRLRRAHKNKAKTKNGFGLMEVEKEHITPQGFLKSDAGYHLIKPQAKSKKIRKRLSPSPVDDTFSFRIFDSGGDINLSMSKDQVFFVMTPELFRQYLKAVGNASSRIEARFKVNNSETLSFIVDLLSIYPKVNDIDPLSHENSIVVVKFHKQSSSSLMRDVSKWSNHGETLGYRNKAELEKIQSAVFRSVPKINDDYFQESIWNDPNWNGVFILNVPIGSPENLPSIFTGITSTQNFFAGETTKEVKLTTPLLFQYTAFPLNKTGISTRASGVTIKTTLYYGLIDYAPFLNEQGGFADYKLVAKHFDDAITNHNDYKFIFSKLFVRFRASSIILFDSYAFVQIPKIFDDNVVFERDMELSNPSESGAPSHPVYISKPNLLRLNGKYQKTVDGVDQISFIIETDLKVSFPYNKIIEWIKIRKIGFSEENHFKSYRFDIDAQIQFAQLIEDVGNVFSFKGLMFQNIGFRFDLRIPFPLPSLDLSKLLVLPDLQFDGNGFLSSFPIRFNRFQMFQFTKTGNTSLDIIDFDFFKLPGLKIPDIDIGVTGSLFSLIFDFDLGTLGDLSGLKALNGQLLLGWSFKGGFVLAFKLGATGDRSLHVDLFGGIKLDITSVDFGTFKPYSSDKCSAYFLRLIDARLTIFGKAIPEADRLFNGIIIADFKGTGNTKKIAWLINLDKNATPPNKLLLAVGQRMGPSTEDSTSTENAIHSLGTTFKVKLKDIDPCKDPTFFEKINFRPERNWILASEDVMTLLSKNWEDVIDIKFIFNDPVLYGLYLGFKNGLLKGFSIDILYKKISDSLGVYAVDIVLPDYLRTYDTGGAYLRLPNIGIEIFTNGDWKSDVGFPRTSNDWSRSGFLQLRTAPPFVGWFGCYVMRSTVPSLTLFKNYLPDSEKVNILQFGFAMRVGLGAYIDGGIFYAGASISVYGILEGAAAFETGQGGLTKFFPDHFAVQGRMGAIAEIVGYVDFGIIKASVYISLRAEFGFLLVYLSKDIPQYQRSAGIQPVKIYIEGEVRVEVTITIGCVDISLSFGAYVRFEYTIGGEGAGQRQTLSFAKNNQIPFKVLNTLADEPRINITIDAISEIPMIYLPAFTKTKESSIEELCVVHNFVIPFFGKSKNTDNRIEFTNYNILKDKIILPFFKNLIEKLESLVIDQPNSYETLRSVLIDGICFQGTDKKLVKVVISEIKGFRPLFIDDINSQDKKIVDDILINGSYGFGFIPSDLKPADPSGNNSIATVYKDSLLLIPAPISPNINVIEKGAKHELKGGFDIITENLISDVTGSPKITRRIEPVNYDEDVLLTIESFFDDYKTQFVNRNNQRAGKKLLQEVDLREQLVIPQYFQLIALLTLESFYSDITAQFKKLADADFKQSISLNPVIRIQPTSPGQPNDLGFHYQYAYRPVGSSMPDLTTIEGDWAINKHLENIGGQLNYFYNSGLRLPFEKLAHATVPIFQMLKQHNVMQPLAEAQRDPEKVSVSISDGTRFYNITKSVFADTAAVRSTWDFIDGFDKKSFALKNLYLEFEKNPQTKNCIQFERPYELLPVTLTVQNGKFNINNKEARFFTVPSRIAQHGKINLTYGYELKMANRRQQYPDGIRKGQDVVYYSTDADDPTVKLQGFTSCLNVGIKVKKKSNRMFEISSVYIDDLNLMNKLLAGANIQQVRCYYEKESDGSATIDLIDLSDKTNPAPVSILKANLSSRTSPPDFGTAFKKTKWKKNILNYSETSDNAQDTNKANFIRLVWEAFTTNNGKYYILVNKDFTEVKNDESFSILLSFELASDQKKIPYYFNAFRLNAKVNDTDVFGLLDSSNDYYLYLDQIKQDDILVTEYHSTIPAHVFGFTLYRDFNLNPDKVTRFKNGKRSEPRRRPNYNNYLPLEFDVLNSTTGERILSREKVLPIMPTSQTTPDKRRKAVPIKDKFLYKHTSPLKTPKKGDKPDHNIHRYDTVGHNYVVTASLRDSFGFRMATEKDFLDRNEFTHLYNDKLVAIDSWPLIKFSFWIDPVAKPLKFVLNAESSILGILDLAGILRKENQLQYKLGDVIKDGYDVINGKKVYHRDQISNVIRAILDTLYSIQAQLTDTKTSLMINDQVNDIYKKSLLATVSELTEKIYDMQQADGSFYLPKKDAVKIPDEMIEITPSPKTVKKRLDISITMSRPSDLCLHKRYADLQGDTVWEYKTTYQTNYHIKQFNRKTPDKSGINDLNDAVQKQSGHKYCLGVSSGEKLAATQLTGSDSLETRIIYVLNEELLSNFAVDDKDLTNTNQFKQNNCYFGIKPFSNKRWSGSYQADVFFNNDLDKSLQLILSKIEELLAPGGIRDNFDSALFEKLVTAKKRIVSFKLKTLADWVMQKPADTKLIEKIQDEVKELVLEDLNKFYAFDGVVAAHVVNTSLPPDHRLSLQLENQKGYRLVSSKIGNGTNYWFIMFDQEKGIQGTIDFEIKPAITHIEFGIAPPLENSEIERSTWIQLIKPVTPKIAAYRVNSWNRIDRYFPDTPVIMGHEAKQLKQEVSGWDDKALGQWNYELKVRDTYIPDNDILHIEMILQTGKVGIRSPNAPNFEGFIAYWAAAILKAGKGEVQFDSKRFIEELFEQTSLFEAASGQVKPDSIRCIFELLKVKAGWELASAENIDRTKIKWWAKGDELKITIGSFDIFEPKDRIKSVLPMIKVYRNRRIQNSGFHYETDTIQPVTPAMPHIRYFDPVHLQDKQSFEKDVFGKIPDLPMKATAKFLIDNAMQPFPTTTKSLPVIPVKQIECAAGSKPIKPDALFSQFQNGFKSFSVTVYDVEKGIENDLPMFFVDTIYQKLSSVTKKIKVKK